MQLDRYIQQTTEEPIDKSSPMPRPVSHYPDVPSQVPLTPYVSDYNPNHLSGILNFASEAMSFVGGIMKEKQENKASTFAAEDELDLVDEVAAIHEEGDYKDANYRIRTKIDELKDSREEELGSYGMTRYENAITRTAASHYQQLVIQEGINTRKANVSNLLADMNSSIKRRDFFAAYSKVAEGLSKQYISIEQIGINPNFPKFDDMVSAYISRDYDLAADYIIQAVETDMVKPGGQLWSINQQIMKEGAREDLSISGEYGGFSAHAFDRKEDGSYEWYPELTDNKERGELQSWSEARYEDKQEFKDKEMYNNVTATIAGWQKMDSDGELTQAYLKSDEVVNKYENDRYIRELSSWQNKLKVRASRATELNDEENLELAHSEIGDWQEDLYRGTFTNALEAANELDLILGKVPDKHKAKVRELYKVNNLYKEIGSYTKTTQDLSVYETIDKLPTSEAVKSELNALVGKHVMDSLYVDGELRKEAPGMEELEFTARNVAMKAYVKKKGGEMSDEAANTFGISKEYTRSNFLEYADANPTGWNMIPFLPSQKEQWQKGVGYMNNGFLTGAVDKGDLEAAKKYHKKSFDLFTSGSRYNDPHNVEETEISSGMLFMKDADDKKWYTLAMPRDVAPGDAEPEFMDMKEFSQQYFVPFPVGQKSFDDSVQAVAARVGKKYPTGMVKGTYIKNPDKPDDQTLEGYLIWTGSGYKSMAWLRDNNMIESVESDGRYTSYLMIEGERYPLQMRMER